MSESPTPPPAPDLSDDTAKPWWKRWWGIAGMLLVALVAIGALGGDADDAEPTASPSPVAAPTPTTPDESPSPSPTATEAPTPTPEPSPTATPLPEPPPTPAPEPSPTPEPTPTPTEPQIPFDAFTIDGSGDDIIDLEVPGGLTAAATFEASGDSNFAVWSYDSSGNQVDLLVNTIGSYHGTRPLNLPGEPEVAELEITASGAWSVTVTSIPALEPKGASFEGTGDDVVWLAEDQWSASRATLTHDGDSNFAIWTHGDGTNLLVNDIGPYDGTVRLSDVPVLWDITASGAWTVTLE